MTPENIIAKLLPQHKGRTGERAAIYRAFISENLSADAWREAGFPHEWSFAASKGEIDKVFADRHRPLDEMQAAMFTEQFLRWYPRWRQAKTHKARAEAGRNGGRPSKSKRKQKTR